MAAGRGGREGGIEAGQQLSGCNFGRRRAGRLKTFSVIITHTFSYLASFY